MKSKIERNSLNFWQKNKKLIKMGGLKSEVQNFAHPVRCEDDDEIPTARAAVRAAYANEGLSRGCHRIAAIQAEPLGAPPS